MARIAKERWISKYVGSIESKDLGLEILEA